jgi:hypothetical protein
MLFLNFSLLRSFLSLLSLNLKLKLHGFSPQENYTDRATAACRRSCCQFLRIECVAWSAQRIPTAVNLGFPDPEPLIFHSSSSSIILPFQTHHFSENLVAPGIESGTSGSVARNSDH